MRGQPCECLGMSDHSRYSLRPGSVELTRIQWCIVVVALVMALVGLGLVFVNPALGGGLMGLFALIGSLIVVIARSQTGR